MTVVVAIVPAKDREDSVADTVRALRALRLVDRVLVVDDGSTDQTSARARAAGAQVLRLGRNRGKGGAVAAGVEAASDADVFLLIDADVAGDARLAETLLEPVLADDVDLTIGVLPAAGKRGGFGTIRRFSTWGIKRACGFDAQAPLSGQRAVRASYLRGLTNAGRFGLEVAMTIDLVRAGARVREVPVTMEHRHTGRSVSGFRHRGAQGVDIVRAMWPRAVSGAVRKGLLAVGVAAYLVVSFAVARALVVNGDEHAVPVDRVVFIGVPYLGLDDVNPQTMPNLDRLARNGAFGLVTVRTRGAARSSSSYASLGASAQLAASASSGWAVGRNETVEGSPAIDVLERRSGKRPEGSIIVPEMPTVRRRAGSFIDSLPGALGDAIHRNNMRTALIANTDAITPDGRLRRGAPAALMVANSRGAIDEGDVSGDLVQHNPRAPYGMEADPAAIYAAFDRVAPDASLIVIDPGETERAVRYQSSVVVSNVSGVLDAALARTDKLIGGIADRLPDNTMLIVASMTPPGAKAELVPLVVSGTGVPVGGVMSPSTGKANLVTLTDLAPTILTALGVTTPPDMIGQALRYRPGDADRGAMRATNDAAINWSRAYGPLPGSFVALMIALYLVAMVALMRFDTPASARRWLRWGFIATATVPAMTFVIRAVPLLGSFGGGTVFLVYLLAAAVAWPLSRPTSHPLQSLVQVAWFGLVLLCVDLLIGGPLQMSSLLGYSPTFAARFSGIGNAAYAVLAASAVIAAAGLLFRTERRRDAWWLAAAIGAVAIIADGAPWLGADVGGILSLIPMWGVLLLLLAGRRLTWRAMGLAVGAAAVGLAVVVGYEATQPAAQRDHIGRFFLGSANGGAFWSTIGRKFSTNLGLLTASTWSQLIPLIAVFLLVILVIGRNWARLFPPHSAERAGLVALLGVAVLGFAVNDSGALVAALVSVFIGSYVGLMAAAEPERADQLFAHVDDGELVDAATDSATTDSATTDSGTTGATMTVRVDTA